MGEWLDWHFIRRLFICTYKQTTRAHAAFVLNLNKLWPTKQTNNNVFLYQERGRERGMIIEILKIRFDVDEDKWKRADKLLKLVEQGLLGFVVALVGLRWWKKLLTIR